MLFRSKERKRGYIIEGTGTIYTIYTHLRIRMNRKALQGVDGLEAHLHHVHGLQHRRGKRRLIRLFIFALFKSMNADDATCVVSRLQNINSNVAKMRCNPA